MRLKKSTDVLMTDLRTRIVPQGWLSLFYRLLIFRLHSCAQEGFPGQAVTFLTQTIIHKTPTNVKTYSHFNHLRWRFLRKKLNPESLNLIGQNNVGQK